MVSAGKIDITYFRFWPLADIGQCTAWVRFRGHRPRHRFPVDVA